MTTTSLWRLTASEAADKLRSGAITAEALAQSCLERIAERDGAVRAWAFIDPQHVIDQARELDKWPEKGPLHGLPVGVKDVIDTNGMPTRHNSPSYFNNRPSVDAACIMTLRAAGALIFGKTETVEFASGGRQPVTRNPHNLNCTPGGSSSGSAAAVADFHVPLSVGTQTGGSMIRPGSFCGVYAMKPTWGIINREGAKGQSISLDTVGWYARSAEDLALLCDAYAIEDDVPTAAVSLAGAKIAICQSPVWERAEADTRNTLARGADLLKAAGAEMVALEMPDMFKALPELQEIIQESEAGAYFLNEYRAHYDGLHPFLRKKVENKGRITRAALRRAYDHAAQCRAAFDEISSEFDAILTPSAPGQAPLGFKTTGWDIFNRIWSLLHAPCVNVPGFVGSDALPVGLSLTGPRFSDRKILAVAKEVGQCFATALTTRPHRK